MDRPHIGLSIHEGEEVSSDKIGDALGLKKVFDLFVRTELSKPV